MRARRRFGMKLHAESRYMFVVDPFARAVVEVHMRYLDILVPAKRIDINTETMVLGGNQDPAACHVFDRVISTMMPELQLESRSAQGQAKNLVTKADAQKRPGRPGRWTAVPREACEPGYPQR